MFHPASANDFRQWAAKCAEQATRRTGEERERLTKMHAALLAIAESADWLEDQRPTGEGVSETSAHPEGA
jgi:cell division septum initiation protein DivIVA